MSGSVPSCEDLLVLSAVCPRSHSAALHCCAPSHILDLSGLWCHCQDSVARGGEAEVSAMFQNSRWDLGVLLEESKNEGPFLVTPVVSILGMDSVFLPRGPTNPLTTVYAILPQMSMYRL